MVEHIDDEDVATIWGLSWIAVRSDDREAVATALGLRETRECSVRAGFEETGRDGDTCFVAPPVDGWTLVISREVAFDAPLLDRLSRTFDEAQAFFADPKRHCYLWRRSRVGETVRHVEVTPDMTPEEIVNTGEGTPPEPSRLTSWKDANEYDVLRVARAWSVDPNKVLRTDSPGRIGILPGAEQRRDRRRRKPNWTAGAVVLLVGVVIVVLLRLLLSLNR